MKKLIAAFLLVLLIASVGFGRRKRRYHHRATFTYFSAYKYYGNGTFNIEAALPRIREFLESIEASDRIRTIGQSSTHNRFDLVHVNAMDVSLPPSSEKGKLLIAFLTANEYPFIAITGRKWRVSTGSHIHIGFPSPRSEEDFIVGTIDGTVNATYYELWVLERTKDY